MRAEWPEEDHGKSFGVRMVHRIVANGTCTACSVVAAAVRKLRPEVCYAMF